MSSEWKSKENMLEQMQIVDERRGVSVFDRIKLAATEQAGYGYEDLVGVREWVERMTGTSLDEIASGNREVAGSDAWCQAMMPFEIELGAIHRYRRNMFDELKGVGNAEAEGYFDTLLIEWLRTEYRSCLTENGCGKYLNLQFPYFSLLGFDEAGTPYISPADLRRFGDQARSYLRANQLVGGGLYSLYSRLGLRGVGGGSLIMSGSELYQDFASCTDVGNAMWVTDQIGDELLVQGQYWMFDKVLSGEQRRFIHNMAYMMGQDEGQFERLMYISEDELRALVPTGRLLFMGEVSEQAAEYEQMVELPNTFVMPHMARDLQHFSEQVSTLFERRFGVELVNDFDVKMYPVVERLVERYLPLLIDALWDKQDKQLYYQILRLMIYECQAHYSELRARQKGSHEWEVEQAVIDHMRMLADGELIVGFEMGTFDLSSDGFGWDSLWKQPWDISEGMEKFCKKHKQTYHGLNCPDCKKESEPSY